jgi:YVTN family beta-propeller protein
MSRTIRRERTAAAVAGVFFSALGLLVLLQFACRKWDNPVDPTGNNPPAAPSSPDPDSGARYVGTMHQLSWACADPDTGDTVRFDIHIDTIAPPTEFRDGWAYDTITPPAMAFKTRYYWCVVARDNHGDSAIGPVWEFTTAATNRVPNRPHSPSPDSGATGQLLGTVLSWKGGDQDTGDAAHYDVYIGTDTQPPMVVASLADSAYTPGDLAYDSTYFWRIVAKDNSGDSIVGPLWLFETAEQIVVTEPDSGERMRMGKADTIRWTGGPAHGSTTYDATRSTARAPRVSYRASNVKRQPSAVLDAADSTVAYRSSDDGATWLRVGQATVPNQLAWSVPGPVTTQGRVRVKAFFPGDSMVAVSGAFEVYDSAMPTPVTVTRPTDTSHWVVGTVQNVTWTGGTDGVDSTTIYFSTDGGMLWRRQGKAIEPGFFEWNVSGPPSATAKIDVRAYMKTTVVNGRSPVFEVLEPPYPDTVIATIGVGPGPRALCWDSIDNRIFVSCYLDSFMSVIDGINNTVITSIGVGSFSSSVFWNPRNNLVYAASETRNTVTVINGASLAVIDTVPVGVKPVAMCWNRTNNRLYVANNRDSSVTVIDCANNEVVGTVAVGASPVALAWNAANNTVYVANFGTASASAINGASNEVTPIPLGHYYPCAVAVDTVNDQVYIAHRNDGLLSVIDGASNSLLTTVEVGEQPWALEWSGMSNRLYCANSGSGTVMVIDCSSHGVIADLPVGAQARSLAWFGLVAKLYVASNAEGTVSIVDAAQSQVVGTVGVGSGPGAFCTNSDRVTIYVANYDSGTLSVIGTGLK